MKLVCGQVERDMEREIEREERVMKRERERETRNRCIDLLLAGMILQTQYRV